MLTSKLQLEGISCLSFPSYFIFLKTSCHLGTTRELHHDRRKESALDTVQSIPVDSVAFNRTGQNIPDSMECSSQMQTPDIKVLLLGDLGVTEMEKRVVDPLVVEIEVLGKKGLFKMSWFSEMAACLC